MRDQSTFDEVTFVVVEYKPILKYRAAEGIAAAGACNAARSLMNVRLLSAEVPLLPLKTCDRPATCKCTIGTSTIGVGSSRVAKSMH